MAAGPLAAALDAIVPALMAEFPESIREENFEPIAFAFIGVHSTVRYFPPIKVYENVPPDLDVSTLADPAAEMPLKSDPSPARYWARQRIRPRDAESPGIVNRPSAAAVPATLWQVTAAPAAGAPPGRRTNPVAAVAWPPPTG